MNIKYREEAHIEIEYIEMQDTPDVCEVVTIALKDRTVKYTIAYDNIIEFKIIANGAYSSSK